MLIVIDPGHGGSDHGATGYGLVEKNLNLSLAKAVQRNLNQYELEVVLTRENDTNPSLNARANYANNLKADFFLSLHTNSGGGSGFESYVYSNAPSSTTALRTILHTAIADYYSREGLPDRGGKKENFAVLRETSMPSVLLENLFIDNARDASYLKAPSFLPGAASAITNGIVRAFDLQPVQVWNPEAEVSRLRELGIVNGDHSPSDPLNWGEFATVINRLIEKYLL